MCQFSACKNTPLHDQEHCLAPQYIVPYSRKLCNPFSVKLLEMSGVSLWGQQKQWTGPAGISPRISWNIHFIFQWSVSEKKHVIIAYEKPLCGILRAAHGKI